MKTYRRLAISKRSLLVGLLVGALFIWLTLRAVDLSEVVTSLRNASWLMSVPFGISLFFFYWLKALRWRRLLKDAIAAPASSLAPPLVIGFAGNNIMPFRVGELIRIVLASQILNLSKTFVTATIVVERFLDIFAITLLVGTGLLAANFGGRAFHQAEELYAGIAIATALSAIAVFLGTQLVFLRPKTLLTICPPTFHEKLRPHVDRFIQGLTSLRTRQDFLAAMGNSVIQWTILSGCIFISLLAVEIDQPFWTAIIILGIITLAITLPSAPGYIGTIEFSFVFALGLFDVSADKALAAGLFYHAITFVLVTTAGLIYYIRLTR
jgi:uncharacterized protein (TIRG00374 family)